MFQLNSHCGTIKSSFKSAIFTTRLRKHISCWKVVCVFVTEFTLKLHTYSKKKCNIKLLFCLEQMCICYGIYFSPLTKHSKNIANCFFSFFNSFSRCSIVFFNKYISSKYLSSTYLATGKP